jgi:hypothetical protein
MMQGINVATMAAGVVMAGFMIYFAAVSVQEHESRAAWRALAVAVVLLLLYGAAGAFGLATQTAAAGSILLVLALAGLVIVTLPGGCRQYLVGSRPGRIGDRDIAHRQTSA